MLLPDSAPTSASNITSSVGATFNWQSLISLWNQPKTFPPFWQIFTMESDTWTVVIDSECILINWRCAHSCLLRNLKCVFGINIIFLLSLSEINWPFLRWGFAEGDIGSSGDRGLREISGETNRGQTMHGRGLWEAWKICFFLIVEWGRKRLERRR